jgi:hypothetical protein
MNKEELLFGACWQLIWVARGESFSINLTLSGLSIACGRQNVFGPPPQGVFSKGARTGKTFLGMALGTGNCLPRWCRSEGLCYNIFPAFSFPSQVDPTICDSGGLQWPPCPAPTSMDTGGEKGSPPFTGPCGIRELVILLPLKLRRS